jgi:hypothetical protein
MIKYVDMLKYIYVGKNKYINAVFDADLNEKLKDKVAIRY